MSRSEAMARDHDRDSSSSAAERAQRIAGSIASALGPILGGGFFRSVVIPLAVIAIGAKLFMLACFTYVGPNEYGIKVVQLPILGSRGVHSQVYATGFHRVLKIGNAEQMFLFPRDIQVLDFTGTREEAAKEADIRKPAHIQTSDGFFVDVDASVIYRISDPYKVFTKLGAGQLFESAGIVPKAEPILKQTLGELTTEEFYDSPKRHAKAELARDLLNKELNPYGLQIDQVLVRYFRYSEEIQRNIEEKKLKDQLVFKNQAEARAAREEAQLKRAVQEGEAAVAIKLQEGAAYITTKDAEKDLYARKKHAEADLLIKLADAKKTQLRSESLQGTGSARMVGLKMAEVYKGLDVIVLPSDGPNGINPLNLDQIVKTLNAKEKE